MTKVLITGGSGLLGSEMSKLLSANGYEVRHLSRTVNGNEPFKTFRWDLGSGYIDENSLEGVEYIIHLAGAGIADERWTKARKKLIIDSRVQGLELLHQVIKKRNQKIKQLISASGIGYYGANRGQELLKESSDSGKDYLAEVVIKWENAADIFKDICPVTKLRIGVVLAENGGALQKMMQPVKWGVGAPLGSGRQILSWIHIHDLCQLFLFVLQQEKHGTYNAVAPNPVSNEALTKAIAHALKKPLWMPKVPAFALKLMLGEMAVLVLGGTLVSSDLIQQAGYQFKFTDVTEAVNDLIG